MNSDKPACTSACTPTYMLSLVHIFSRAYPWMATLFATLLLYLHTLTSTLPHICSYVFNVTMLNQAKAQCAPAISVQTCLDDTSSLMDRDGTTILAQSGAVHGDAEPFKIIAANFMTVLFFFSSHPCSHLFFLRSSLVSSLSFNCSLPVARILSCASLLHSHVRALFRVHSSLNADVQMSWSRQSRSELFATNQSCIDIS